VQPPPAARTAADAEGRYSAALFVQWVPYELAGTSWEAEEGRYVQHLLGLLDRFAPGGLSRPAPAWGEAAAPPMPHSPLWRFCQGLRSAPLQADACRAAKLPDIGLPHPLTEPAVRTAAPPPPAAPGASSLVVDSFTLTPPVIERYFGITRGHIHHIDNSFGFADRFPYRTPLEVGPCRLPGRPRGTRYACWALQRASRVAHMNAGLVKWVPCPQPSHA
jgi:hypothetical protein